MAFYALQGVPLFVTYVRSNFWLTILDSCTDWILTESPRSLAHREWVYYEMWTRLLGKSVYAKLLAKIIYHESPKKCIELYIPVVYIFM